MRLFTNALVINEVCGFFFPRREMPRNSTRIGAFLYDDRVVSLRESKGFLREIEKREQLVLRNRFCS